ncbi:hypothetical protein chiPu_0032752 [Chiloscyllium punctatum]|uniref:Uncharacterized protein n=1 Tax=Chiloscyllium punctatum TaxID=137246 RepID=A0A401U1F3_CHIPU|nr:hypothetical protein [Chiloscyllium punctatum]
MACRKQRRRWKAPLQFADDDLGVAIDVGTDLHRRRAAVAAGHRHQVRPRHDPGNPHRVPGELLESEDDADLLGERRLVEMMQDRRGLRHGLLPGQVAISNGPCRIA